MTRSLFSHHLLALYLIFILSLQSINVVKCQEFWDLPTYVGCENIEDKDIPHCAKATQLVFEEYEECNEKQKERTKV